MRFPSGERTPPPPAVEAVSYATHRAHRTWQADRNLPRRAGPSAGVLDRRSARPSTVPIRSPRSRERGTGLLSTTGRDGRRSVGSDAIIGRVRQIPTSRRGGQLEQAERVDAFGSSMDSPSRPTCRVLSVRRRGCARGGRPCASAPCCQRVLVIDVGLIILPDLRTLFGYRIYRFSDTITLHGQSG